MVHAINFPKSLTHRIQTFIQVKREPCDTGNLLVKAKTKAKRSEETKSRRYCMDNITVGHRHFQKIFIPLYINFMMTIENPFDIHDSQVIPGIQSVYNSVFPFDKQQITEENPIKYVVRNVFFHNF